MRVGERDRQTPRAPRSVIRLARQLVEFLPGVECYLVVILHLVGDFGNARAGHRAEIVVPPVDPLARLAIVWCPAKIRRVDIRGQALFKAVQLVGTDEMHLAGEAGIIARAAQMVRVGRDIRDEFGCIVIDPGA